MKRTMTHHNASSVVRTALLSIRFLVCLAVVGLVGAPLQGRAANSACTFLPGPSQLVFAGVQSQSVTVECSSGISTAHVVRVDLTTKGVSLVTLTAGSASAPQMLLVSKALQMQNQIGVNANLFTNCCSYTGPGTATALLGLAYSNGVMWSPIGNDPQKSPPPGDFLSSLIVTQGRVSIVTLAKGQALPAGLTLAVTGSHRILTEGRNTAPTDTSPGDWFGPNARTVVGYNAGRNNGSAIVAPRLWIIAVDSVRGVSSGVTLPQAADLLSFLGASDGINLDGGGSTTMVQQVAGAAAFVNTPKDWPPLGGCQVPVTGPGAHCERYVGFGLGVAAEPLP
jgi:hypothetical protein